jgi:uncharacterized membrane protein
MVEFLAFIIAVIALIIATKAKSEARQLRDALAHMQRGMRGEGPVASSELRVPGAAAPDSQPPVNAPATAPAVAPAAGFTPMPVFAPPPFPEHATRNTQQDPPPTPEPIPVFKPASAPKPAIDWESLVGIKLFGWIAGIALVLAAVFLFKYSVEHGWLRPAVRATFGFITGIGLLIVCEMRIARNYKFTANAMLGAGIAILYATLFALFGRWHLWPAPAAFFGMLLVTAAAVFLSTRRDSVFIALLGLLGGFATPALLSSGENRPIALFSYLLLLNGGISWIAFRKRWPLLTALSVTLTAIYQWAWVSKFLTSGQLPLAAAVFVVFAIVGALLMWQQGDGDSRQKLFRGIGAVGAVLPLLFAFFTAIVPEYGARYNVLFGFLLLVAAGLAAISLWRGQKWLHSLGALATLLTFFIWLTVSYTPQSWPWSLVWLAVFVVLYLVVRMKLDTIAVYAAPLLFFVFIGVAIREPYRFTLIGAMLALLAILIGFASRIPQWRLAPIAIALSSIAVMTLHQPTWFAFAGTEVVLFATLFANSWISEDQWLALTAIPLFFAVLVVADNFSDAQELGIAAMLYALFVIYPASLGARVRSSIFPHLSAVIASVIFLFLATDLRNSLGYADWIGAIPVLQAVLLFGLMILLLRLDPMPLRLGIVSMSVIAFLTIAVPLQFNNEWMALGWIIEATALAWLFTRIRQNALLFWIGGLSLAVLLRLWATGRFENYIATYLLCAAATFVIAYLVPKIRPITASIATIELFTLLNLAIADYYQHQPSSSLARDLTYTFAWTLFAIVMLVAGIVLRTRAGRVAALGLLVVTVLKCFLHDLGELGGLYRVASLFGLAVSLVLVGLVLQKFVIMKREPAPSETSHAPTGTT